MKSKIEFTKADKSSFDGAAADRYSADEVALVSQHDAKLMLPEGWIYTHIDLPAPLQTVWISNGKGFTTLGCRTPADADGNWCWAETNGTIYEHDRQIVSECEEDDLEVVVWHPLPVTPAFR